jgi:hypothetical protein
MVSLTMASYAACSLFLTSNSGSAITFAMVSRAEPIDGPAAAAAFAPTRSAPFSNFLLSVSFFSKMPSIRRFPSK